MTDDPLKRSGDALRLETSQPELRSGLTRARVLDDAAKARKRTTPLRWLLPFAIMFGTSTALAHVTHEYFPEVWNAVVPTALERPLPNNEELVRRAPKPAKKAVVGTPAPTHVPEPVPAPAPEPEIATPQPEAALAPKLQRTKRPHAPAVAHEEPATPEPVLAIEPAPAAAPAESAELALFRRAQKLHSAKDQGAISAWDDFLRVAPKSPLATEARYNRALGLIRAGRSDDARKALAPFAHGDMGGYRKREAAELIEALDDRDAGVRNR
jgi:hypothetical protein